jgi:hypothetical protein
MGWLQDKKAAYVAKQDANEARNPGGSAGGGNTRDKKNPTDAYGSSAIGGKDQGETQVQVCKGGGGGDIRRHNMTLRCSICLGRLWKCAWLPPM